MVLAIHAKQCVRLYRDIIGKHPLMLNFSAYSIFASLFCSQSWLYMSYIRCFDGNYMILCIAGVRCACVVYGACGTLFTHQ